MRGRHMKQKYIEVRTTDGNSESRIVIRKHNLYEESFFTKVKHRLADPVFVLLKEGKV